MQRHMQLSTESDCRINNGGSDGKGKDNGNSNGDRNCNRAKDKIPGMCLSVSEIKISS
jgi:hypothetical protein